MIEGMTVDAGAVVRSPVTQMLVLPVTGMLARQFAEDLLAVVQLRVAMISNIALYVLIVAKLMGRETTSTS